MIEAGANPLQLAEALGHSDANGTVSGRTHVLQLEPRSLSEASACRAAPVAVAGEVPAVERHLSETHEGQEVPE